jgi:hypothetical protein
MDPDQTRRGRIIAVLIAGVGMAWIAILALGDTLGWSQRTLAFFDLAALAGFTMALWLIYGLWRASRNNKGPDAKD